MANQGELMPNHPVHANVDVQAQQRHLVDAARTLMLLGAAAAVSTSAAVCDSNPDAEAAWVFFLAFVTWLLGVCLLSLVPLAGRFPEGDRLVGAAIASAGALLMRFFIPWN